MQSKHYAQAPSLLAFKFSSLTSLLQFVNCTCPALSGILNRKSKMAKARKPSEKLKPVTPSGKRDESFFELVFEVVRQIPKGRVTSYGAIAVALGTKMSARMVGWAMNASHITRPKVPAHRVVNRNGLLTGKMHFAHPDQMQELLEKEGVKVENDKVVDFHKRFWDPATEL